MNRRPVSVERRLSWTARFSPGGNMADRHHTTCTRVCVCVCLTIGRSLCRQLLERRRHAHHLTFYLHLSRCFCQVFEHTGDPARKLRDVLHPDGQLDERRRRRSLEPTQPRPQVGRGAAAHLSGRRGDGHVARGNRDEHALVQTGVEVLRLLPPVT